MEKSGKSVWAALRRVAQPEKPLDLLVAVWPLMVGERLAARTQPVAWKHGRVEVAVNDREWKKQLEHAGQRVQTQINRWWGSKVVREIVFVRGDEEKSSARHRLRATPRPPAPRSRAEVESDVAEALEKFERTLEGMEEKELRALIARIASSHLPKKAR